VDRHASADAPRHSAAGLSPRVAADDRRPSGLACAYRAIPPKARLSSPRPAGAPGGAVPQNRAMTHVADHFRFKFAFVPRRSRNESPKPCKKRMIKGVIVTERVDCISNNLILCAERVFPIQHRQGDQADPGRDSPQPDPGRDSSQAEAERLDRTARYPPPRGRRAQSASRSHSEPLAGLLNGRQMSNVSHLTAAGLDTTSGTITLSPERGEERSGGSENEPVV
jgi:hypothetical protein